MIKNLAINRNLSVKSCWKMVNAVNTLEKASIAENWLKNNDIISNEEYDDLMNALSYLVRELYEIK